MFNIHAEEYQKSYFKVYRSVAVRNAIENHKTSIL